MVDGGENIEQVQIRVIEKDKKNSNLDRKSKFCEVCNCENKIRVTFVF